MGSGQRNELFADVVKKDLIPMIDAAYRTRAGRAHRAIAGLSMGAGQALRIGIANPELFSYIGAFSGVLRDPAPARDAPPVWESAGSIEAPRI